MITEIIKGRDVVLKKEIISKIVADRLKPEEISGLKKIAMNEEKTEFGMMALSILGKVGDIKSINRLIELTRDSNFTVRYMASKSLIFSGESSINPILKIITKMDEENLRLITEVLRSIEKSDVTPFLAIYQSAPPNVKVSMARVLGSFGPNEKAIIILIKSLASPDYKLTRAIIESLVDIGNRVLPILNKLVQSSHPRVVEIIYEVMRRIGEPAKALIHDGLKSSNINIRRAAAKSLDFAKDDTSCDLLIEALGDRDMIVAENASDSLLKRIDEETFKRKLMVKFRESSNQNQKLWFLRIFHHDVEYFEEDLLGYFRSDNFSDKIIVERSIDTNLNPTIFGRFVGLLNDDNLYVREFAIDRLVNVENKQLPELTAFLGDSRKPIVNGIIEVFRRMGKRGVNYLIELVLSGNDEQKFNSAYALGVLGDKKAIEPLRTLLTSGNDWVRQYAIKALGNLGDMDTILKMVNGDSEDNKKLALEALALMGPLAFMPLINILRTTSPDKREKIAKIITSMGDSIKFDVDELLQKEEDENIRFWLMKISRNIGKKNEFFL